MVEEDEKSWPDVRIIAGYGIAVEESATIVVVVVWVAMVIPGALRYTHEVWRSCGRGSWSQRHGKGSNST